MKQLSWNITEISSSPTITAENHFTVTPIVTGYILSIKGGRCFEYTKNVTLPQYDYVFLPDYGIDLENGANYTAQLSAMNEVAIGNFSMPYRFTTSSLGSYSIDINLDIIFNSDCSIQFLIHQSHSMQV